MEPVSQQDPAQRKLEYLSPSSIAKWENGVEEFYLHYLTPNRPPREPQTQPMSIGSAFDAYCKSYLHDKLFGKNHPDSNRFDFNAIFEAQVEPQHRDWALLNGAYAFQLYKESGALTDLLVDLKSAKSNPRFEFEVRGLVNSEGHTEAMAREINGVTLLGKPDAAYINKDNVHVILDWKVNGYCSKYPTSPMKGYVRLRGAGGQSWGCHKECSPFEIGGMTINIGAFLEHFKTDWAQQLSIYAWLCGESIGSDFVVAVDQLSCKPSYSGYPTVRVAEHRIRISRDFQWRVFRRSCEIWEIIHSGHLFRDLSLEESIARCQLLDQQAEVLYGGNTEEDRHWLEMTNRGPRF